MYLHQNYGITVLSKHIPMYSADELNTVEPELIDIYESLGSPINSNGDFI